MLVTLITIHLLAFAIWVGSLAALPIAVRLVRQVADASVQAAFFPRLGQAYARLGTAALIVAILSGAALAGNPGKWAGVTLGAVVVAVVVLGVTTIAMVQAHRVGKLRSALASGAISGPEAESTLHRQVRITDAMRGAIVAGTLLAVVLEAATIASL